jgi:hypothetical protein
MQFAADGSLGRGVVVVAGQVLAQQRDGPLDGPIAQRVGRPGQRLRQGGPPLLGPDRGMVPAPAVAEAVGGLLVLEAAQPLVDAHPAGAQQASDLSDGPTSRHLQDGEDSAVQHGVACAAELLLQVHPLPLGQLESAHGIPQPTGYCSRSRV